jgi:pyruvate,water dikinase
MTSTLVWLQDLGKDDVTQAGGKGANLGELIRAGLPVPPGFVVTADAYRKHVARTGLRELAASLLSDFDPGDRDALLETSRVIKRRFETTEMSAKMTDHIRGAYARLGAPRVAVRSSATAEDLPEASFAGQQLTFLNISGADGVIEAVRHCWASLYEPQAIFYRAQRGYSHDEVAIAVPVQKMVQPAVAGIMFTVDPVTGATDRIFIEAVWGLGEAAVSGMVTPDTYVVDRRTMEEVERNVVLQEQEIVGDPDADGLDATVWRDVPASRRDVPKLSRGQTPLLAELGVKAEEHFGCPQDLEWAMEGDGLLVLQARPVTGLA